MSEQIRSLPILFLFLPNDRKAKEGGKKTGRGPVKWQHLSFLVQQPLASCQAGAETQTDDHQIDFLFSFGANYITDGVASSHTVAMSWYTLSVGDPNFPYPHTGGVSKEQRA